MDKQQQFPLKVRLVKTFIREPSSLTPINMDFYRSLLFTILLLFPYLGSAWRIQLYREPGYQVLIVDESGAFDAECQNLPADLNDRTSSLHWDSEGVFGLCTIMLYRNPNCAINIGRSTGDWHNPRFSDANDNAVSSWRVICPEP